MNHKNYNTEDKEKKAFYIALVVIAVIIITLLVLGVKVRAEKNWDVCYPMVNQHIEWTYAGRS